jgi:hypothetical protein
MDKSTLIAETINKTITENLFETETLFEGILKKELSTLPFETTFTPPNQVSYFDEETKEVQPITFEITANNL